MVYYTLSFVGNLNLKINSYIYTLVNIDNKISRFLCFIWSKTHALALAL